MAAQLHFAWVTPDEPFDAGAHARADEQVHHVVVREAEGAVPTAEVTLATPDRALIVPGLAAHALLSATVEGICRPLFRGRLMAAPVVMGTGTLTLRFEARLGDHAAATAAALAPFRVGPGYDSLFVRDGDEDDPEVVLRGWLRHLWTDRRDGTVAVSHDTTGGHTDHVTRAAVAADSVRWWLAAPPYHQVTLTATARWHQEGRGTLNLGREIWRQNGGPLQTLTPPESFAAGWPRAGESLGSDTGYRVRQAALVEMPPPADPHMPYEARYTMMDDHDGPWNFSGRSGRSPWYSTGGSLVSLRKRTYDPQLFVDWHYRQKREEHLTLTLVGAAQDTAEGPDATQPHLWFDLGDVAAVPAAAVTLPDDPLPADCLSLIARAREEETNPTPPAPPAGTPPVGDARRAGFFLTDRGRQALDHAVQLAAVTLARSQRAVRIAARLPGWTARTLDVTCDSTLTLDSPRLPGGQATGKVVALALIWDHGVPALEVTLAASLGTGSTLDPAVLNDPYGPDYSAPGVYAHPAGAVRDSHGDVPVTYHDPGDQAPTLGLVALPHMTENEFLERLCLVNLAPEQEAWLWERQRIGFWPPTEVQAVPSDVALALTPLTAVDVLPHTITVTPTGPVGLPATLDLATPLEE